MSSAGSRRRRGFPRQVHQRRAQRPRSRAIGQASQIPWASIFLLCFSGGEDRPADSVRKSAASACRKTIEFIPIKSFAAKGSGEPESYATHSRFPSLDRECPASTAEAGL